MKVFICVVLFAAIASAIPVENIPTPEPTDSIEGAESKTEVSPQLNQAENPIPTEDAQSENAKRNKRFIFFSLGLPAVYAYPSSVVYAAPAATVTKVVAPATVKVTKQVVVQPAVQYVEYV